ncbi:unnamed protein product [Alopecurus aequalis]
MAATAKDVRAAHVPDEIRRWRGTLSNGVTVDGQADEEEPEVDPDSDFEQAAEEEQNAGVAASESDGKMKAAAQARVQEQSSCGRAATRHGDEAEVSEDGNVQTQGVFLLGRKRKAIVTSSKPQTTGTIHDKNDQGECLRAENEMLRLQLVRKTKELEAEQIRRLELELRLKNKEIILDAKPPRNPRLCRSCNKYVLGHDYRNCPERRAFASSEQDEGDDSSQHS